jgi:hypothetical protein
VVLLSSDGNTNYQGAKGSAINSLYQRAPTTPEAYNGQAVGFVQRQVTRSMVFDVGYLPFTTDLNQVLESKLGPNDAAFRPYPFQNLQGYTTDGIANYHAFQTGLTSVALWGSVQENERHAT